MLLDALLTISYKQSLRIAFICAILLGIYTTSMCLYIRHANQPTKTKIIESSRIRFDVTPVLTLFISPQNELKTPSRTKMCHTVDEAFSTI